MPPEDQVSESGPPGPISFFIGAEKPQGSISNFFIGDYDQEEDLASFSSGDDAGYEGDSVETQTGGSSECDEPAGNDHEDTDDDLPFAQYVPHHGERSMNLTVVKVTRLHRSFIPGWQRPSPERNVPAVAILAVYVVSEPSEPFVADNTAEPLDGPSCDSRTNDDAGPAGALRGRSQLVPLLPGGCIPSKFSSSVVLKRLNLRVDGSNVEQYDHGSISSVMNICHRCLSCRIVIGKVCLCTEVNTYNIMSPLSQTSKFKSCSPIVSAACPLTLVLMSGRGKQ